MPGMGPVRFSDLNPLVTALFRHGLYVSVVPWLIGLAVGGVLLAAWRGWLPRFNLSPAGLGEPRHRTLLRVSFGALWVVDGVLQCQDAMPLGLASRVVAPSADGAPAFVISLVRAGVGVWNNHPVALAIGVAWFQIGLGVVLLSSNGKLGRAIGALSAVYALAIWVVGNALGGIFSPTSSLLFGWPGAALFYVVAGFWLSVAPGFFSLAYRKVTTKCLAFLLAGGAFLQMLPSRGFWRGGDANAFTQMSREMTSVPQPQWLATCVRGLGTVAGTMGGGFNLTIILWLLLTVWGLWRRPQSTWPFVSTMSFALVFWVEAQDTALFGGLATDVNSLLPMGALALAAMPGRDEPFVRRSPKELRSLSAGVLASFGLAAVLVGLVLFIVVPFRGTENSLYLAANNTTALAVRTTAPDFTLHDQFGRTVSLHEYRGHPVVLTFLDPRCWTDCPLLGAQMRSLAATLPRDTNVRFVAIAANPYHHSQKDLNDFIVKYHLNATHFTFVTGETSALKEIWLRYGIGVTMKRSAKMSLHSNDVFIIGPRGRLRWVVPDEPMSSWSGQKSAIAVLRDLLRALGE